LRVIGGFRQKLKREIFESPECPIRPGLMGSG
jgi:hypothetical protein